MRGYCTREPSGRRNSRGMALSAGCGGLDCSECSKACVARWQPRMREGFRIVAGQFVCAGASQPGTFFDDGDVIALAGEAVRGGETRRACSKNHERTEGWWTSRGAGADPHAGGHGQSTTCGESGTRAEYPMSRVLNLFQNSEIHGPHDF